MSGPVDLYHVLDGPADGPPVVLSNSLGTNLDMWRPQVAELRRRARLIRYDQRGHGRSPLPPGAYEIDDLGRDLLGLLDRLGIERAHLVGLSLGAMTAMWVAAQAPERVDRLVLLSTSARLGPPEHWRDRAAKVRAGGTAAVVDAAVGRWFTPGFAGRQPATVQWAREMFLATPSMGYVECCGVIERMDLEPALSWIRASALVLGARPDPATPPVHHERIAAGIPGARLVLLDDGAHLVNVERAGEVTALILEHLALDTSKAAA